MHSDSLDGVIAWMEDGEPDVLCSSCEYGLHDCPDLMYHEKYGLIACACEDGIHN